MKRTFLKTVIAIWFYCGCCMLYGQQNYLLNEPIDISPAFRDFTNTYFLADSLSAFDAANGTGKIKYQRAIYHTRQAFNNMLAVLRPFQTIEFPEVYDVNPELPFSVEFVSPRTIRIRALSAAMSKPYTESLMFVETPPKDRSWKYEETKNGHRYKSEYGSIEIDESPFCFSIYDKTGQLLTKTRHNIQNDTTLHPNLPFAFVRRANDYSRSFNAAFDLGADEKIFGCGESFSSLNKRGQKIVLWVDDSNGVENQTMYKPVPFYMSSNGYGVFIHTTSPITCDFGHSFMEASNLMIGDDELDMFFFIGNPKEILDEYTNLTGKSPMPPLWSFGTWMSRITYFSEEEGYDVASKIRAYKIPADVIHFDTGWFENDWECDYEFSKSRFENPEKMISDLRKDGFHISLWQLPYFIPQNKYFNEIVEKNLFVRDAKGNVPYEDAILDFSNPQAITWYQDKLAGLLRLGVGAIKVDFGEAGPHTGLYFSGSTGFYEHNLYPLRYNKTASDITLQINDEHIIWARSAWAGSQRYPVHWGGDAANTDNAMFLTLRGGLSLGVCGFSFWSHDIGGFVQKTPEELYRRWLPFGMLTSHTRTHGAPPKEPWLYNTSFVDAFRESAEMRYKLMPYIYAQAKDCSEKGLPMLRALFIEFPDDPGAWLVEDQYLFGSDMLVAPFFVSGQKERNVYLPGGNWVDYQTGQLYRAGWNKIRSGKIPAIILVKEGAVIPHIKLAQSTDRMDWSKLDLFIYGKEIEKVQGLVCIPGEDILHTVTFSKERSSYKMTSSPIQTVSITVKVL